jgi:hypothetical protein
MDGWRAGSQGLARRPYAIGDCKAPTPGRRASTPMVQSRKVCGQTRIHGGEAAAGWECLASHQLRRG